MTLDDLFAAARDREPRRPALLFRDAAGARSSLDHGELHDRAARLAAGLRARGIAPGDRVALFLGNRPEFAIAYLACVRAGAIAVPLNPRYRRGELGHILPDAGPRLLVTEPSLHPVLEEIPSQARRTIEAVAEADHLPSWAASEPLPPHPAAADDPVLLLYTSGTTGPAKGAVLTHRAIRATVTGLIEAWRWTARDRLLLCLPLFHTHGLVVGLHSALGAGAAVLLRPGFDAGEVIAELATGEATLFFGVPTLYVRLVEALVRRPRPDFSRVRLFCSGSAPLAPETFHRFEALTGHRILERYGMTETGMTLSNPLAGPRVPGSVGLPLPGVSIRIVGEAGIDIPPGEGGELLVRGDNVFAGYWNAPEKTAEAFVTDREGNRWFRTGDLARRDPATGFVTLLGRRHDVILSGGFNIYPREIEEALLQVEGVVEAAVVGRPHPEWGEVPVAYVVRSAPVEAETLATRCRAELASYKVPREIRFVDRLPRNAMGKVDRAQLG